MSEVLWWRKESWYEARSIPLFGLLVSPRQVLLVLAPGLLGLAASAAVPVYYAKVAVVLAFTVAGAALASAPSGSVPWELAALYGILKAGRKGGRAERREEDRVPEVAAGSGVPLAVTGEARAERPVEVVLLVDGVERAREVVGPGFPRYRLYYYPGDDERGAHDLEVVIGGETVSRIRANVV